MGSGAAKVGSTQRRPSLGWAACCLAIVLLLALPAAAEDWDVMPDGDVAGPVVKISQSDGSIVGSSSDDSSEASDAAAEGPAPAKKTIAQMIDEALEQEFQKEKETAEAEVGKQYNETAKMEEATVMEVVKVSSSKKEKPQNATAATEGSTEGGVEGATNSTTKAKAKLDTSVEKEVDRIIDSEDNEYVLSKPKEQGMGLTLDPQLIRDLTILISSSSGVGLGMEALGQPTINGYFIAGSLVGPGGLRWVKELVQVQSVAQLGVSLLLFTLGLEFSLSKLRAVRGVAMVGGVLEIVLMSILSGVMAKLIGGRTHEGIFTGLLVAMSSTSIVVKCLADMKASNSAVGQITIGTLVLQDLMVGLIFAFMPLLSHATGQSEVDQTEVAMVVLKVTAKLAMTVIVAIIIARVLLQPAVRVLVNHVSAELYQLSLVAYCLLCAMITGHLGLSTELGAFIGGVMLSTTDQQENAMHQVEPISKIFVTLFIASTGLLMSPIFLLQHLPVLTAGLLLVVVSKTLLFSFVVWIFGYSARTCVAVGLSMAQIGEFAFVLLSIARSSELIQHQLYMLLMGVTAISLLITPSLLQVARWLLSSEAGSEMGGKMKHKRSGILSDDPEMDKAGSPTPVSSPQEASAMRRPRGAPESDFSAVSQIGLAHRGHV